MYQRKLDAPHLPLPLRTSPPLRSPTAYGALEQINLHGVAAP